MAEFILQEQIENVICNNTKEYLKEVISSYNNGNYRAAVVVLYTAVIYDLLQKIVVLKEIYNDKGAEKILNDIKTQQTNNPKSPAWETDLIEKIFKETKIISNVEKEELFYIKDQRNYAAHPIVTIDGDNEKLELKQITKETAIDIIRKAFEIVFLRDAILAKNIVCDIVSDLNEFYKRVNTNGLEEFLNTKYFRRMTQERKDYLFISLWKFVFIVEDIDCNKNRESNYWGLVFLYNEDKTHYRNLISKDEDNYSNKLQLETIKSWNEKNDNNIDYKTLISFKKTSRTIYLIKFLEQAPEIYKTLNEYAKNILQQSINYMFIENDVTETPNYKAINQNIFLFEEQVKLKSNTVFLSDDISDHFNMIFRMIDNYMCTARNWTEPNNYCVLNDENIQIIFHQSEYRGCTEEFLRFLIRYCIGAQKYSQATVLFNYITKFKKYLKEEHYFMILEKMNDNSQFYRNDEKGIIIRELENMFMDSFDAVLVGSKEERCLYYKLYGFDIKNNDYNVEKVLESIENRAMHYSVWNLYHMIIELLDYSDNKEVVKRYEPSSYPNILSVLSNKSDANYDEYHVENFNNYFK